MSRSFTRRSFLKVATAGVAGVVLAACTPKVVEVTKIVTQKETVKETVIVEKEAQPAGPEKKVVRIMLSSWAVREIPFDRLAREFNEKNPGVEVKIETDAEGWDTKMIAQINSGKVDWSAVGILTPFLDMARWTAIKMVQPMDDFIAASKVEGATSLMSDMIDTVKTDASFQGKFYSVPYSFENITFNWRVDYFNAVGAKEAPATWDDWYRIVKEVQKWGADQQIIATSFAGALWTDIGALICSSMKKPYTDEGLIAWQAPEAVESLAFFKKLVSEKLTPPHGSDGWYEMFTGGKIGSVQAQSSRGVWGQMIFGAEKMATSPIPEKVKGGGSGTVYWGNGVALVNKAPYPQEAMDYIVYAMGPQNLDFQKTVIKSGKTPVYKSAYDKIILADPAFATYKWMTTMRDDVARSVPVPVNTYYLIQHTMYTKNIVLFTDEGSAMSAEECAQKILKDSKDEIAKQKL